MLSPIAMIHRRALPIVLLLLAPPSLLVQSLQVYSIGNASLVSFSSTNITTRPNVTCDQCLCSAWQRNSSAFNCFSNNRTCQFFDPFPQIYRIQSSTAARLYFPRGTLPNKSTCCMPDLNELLAKLSSATMTPVSVAAPRCLVVDNHGYLVTVQDSGNELYRINPHNMTLINSTTLPGGGLMNIAYYQQAYYVTRNDQSVLIIDSNHLTVINTITFSGIDDPRDMIFLHNGRTMILASASNKDLLFFNLVNNATRDYTYASKIDTTYDTPHGLWYVNDSFFYATSWTAEQIYSHSTNDNISWTERLIADAGSIPNGVGSHVTVDDCQRLWFSLRDAGLRIFNNQGALIGNFTLTLSTVFDMLLMENYVMYLSDVVGNRIIRLNPQITC